MFGLAGIISTNLQADNLETARRMVAALSRAPDRRLGAYNKPELGVWCGWLCDKGVFNDCLPIWNERQDICLLFSGECFRLEQGTQDLPKKGPLSDVENLSCLVRLYEKEGISFIKSINGWFSGILVDLKERKVILFNDRYGLGRLYIHETAGAVFFASEAKSLLAVIPELRRVDARALGEWLTCGCALQNRTLFNGVSLLPGGSVWVFSADGTVAKQKYFDPATWENQSPLSEAEYYERLKELFPRVLKRYFQGRKPIGMSLTGGLDGRMVMAWSPQGPGALPCYTFNGPYRECTDVRIAQRVASACHQSHRVIPVGNEFLSNFSSLAEKTIAITDGAMDVTGAAELYVNQQARQIAPVRLTGNYGSEILRDNVAFRPRQVDDRLFDRSLARQVEVAADTFAEEIGTHRRSFIAFKQVPWHHFARFALERSQLDVRSPFLDNDLVALAFRVPVGTETSLAPALRLIAEGSPGLGGIPTDRGVIYPADRVMNKIHRSWADFLARAEYAFDYGMPQWLARADHLLGPLRLERLFLGRQKFCHFRVWYRDELARYVQEMLLDPKTLNRPYLNRKNVEKVVGQHTSGRGNHTRQIHQLLTLELIQRQLIEQNQG